jgi:uncharacterized membrane-anchored protein YjiN (DUF445 family)
MFTSNADEQEIKTFLTEWLVDFRDLPPDLERTGQEVGERISELFVRIGESLDAVQRDRLNSRLRKVRDDFLNLQKQPRMAPKTC